MTANPELILHRGLFTTLDRANPTASAVAITDGLLITGQNPASSGPGAKALVEVMNSMTK